MAFTTRQTIVFVAGLAIGVAAAWAVFGRHAGSDEPAGTGKSAAASTRAMGAAPVTVAAGACDFKPLVATAASDDGRVQLQESLSGRGPKDVESWLLEGKEAVAAGRQRDAEADFLMACRAAEQLGDAGVLPQAEAMYHLGRHYAGVAGAMNGGRADELWKRAEGLFSASLRAFDARYGQDSDKTRFAAKGLAEVQAHAGGGAPAVAAAPQSPEKDKAPEATVAKAVPPPPAPAPVKVEVPKIETPRIETPKIQTPKIEAPKIETAKAEAPKIETAKAEAPKEPVARPAPPKQEVAKAEPARPTPAPAPAPKAAPEPKPAPAPKPAVGAKPREPEPQVAVAKPAPPRPRVVEQPRREHADTVIVEPAASASGSATGVAPEREPAEQ